MSVSGVFFLGGKKSEKGKRMHIFRGIPLQKGIPFWNLAPPNFKSLPEMEETNFVFLHAKWDTAAQNPKRLEERGTLIPFVLEKERKNWEFGVLGWLESSFFSFFPEIFNAYFLGGKRRGGGGGKIYGTFSSSSSPPPPFRSLKREHHRRRRVCYPHSP